MTCRAAINRQPDYSLCCPPNLTAGWRRNPYLATVGPVALSPSGNPCAWCEREHGIKASPDDSHGICVRHIAEVKATVKARTR